MLASDGAGNAGRLSYVFDDCADCVSRHEVLRVPRQGLAKILRVNWCQSGARVRVRRCFLAQERLDELLWRAHVARTIILRPLVRILSCKIVPVYDSTPESVNANVKLRETVNQTCLQRHDARRCSPAHG